MNPICRRTRSRVAGRAPRGAPVELEQLFGLCLHVQRPGIEVDAEIARGLLRKCRRMPDSDPEDQNFQYSSQFVFVLSSAAVLCNV